jgi:hypothetical protein
MVPLIADMPPLLVVVTAKGVAELEGVSLYPVVVLTAAPELVLLPTVNT